MYLKTLYVMDPIDKIDVGGDSTYMLMLEVVGVVERSHGAPTISSRSPDAAMRDVSV